MVEPVWFTEIKLGKFLWAPQCKFSMFWFLCCLVGLKKKTWELPQKKETKGRHISFFPEMEEIGGEVWKKWAPLVLSSFPNFPFSIFLGFQSNKQALNRNSWVSGKVAVSMSTSSQILHIPHSGFKPWLPSSIVSLFALVKILPLECFHWNVHANGRTGWLWVLMKHWSLVETRVTL